MKMEKTQTISVVIPTKNEENSIGICIEKIQKVFNEHHIDGEIIIADNSTDNTPEIAKNLGAKVIIPDKLGYGNAYRFGFEHASGDYIVMGDGNNTYDFMDIQKLLEPLKRGEADLVMGSRFKGEIKKGAMPWHHQYIGNPFLTWIFNRANKSNISDTHSGFRAFTTEAYEKIRTDLKTTRMEFASEMLEVAVKNNLKIAEVPITYYPRPEGSEPNLSSFSDGGRHLKHIFLRAPTLLFLIPGFILFALGLLLVLLIWNPFNLWATWLGIHSMIKHFSFKKRKAFSEKKKRRKRVVCKDLWLVSWFEETRPDNGIYFGAHYITTRCNSGTGDIPCGVCLYTTFAAELDRERVYGFAGVGSGYCRTYAAGDWIADDILFVLFECDWRGGGRIKCKIKMQSANIYILSNPNYQLKFKLKDI
jgi:glycosyltransferase involved in cell wall biosynthesis